jgi:hypothetical protein
MRKENTSVIHDAVGPGGESTVSFSSNLVRLSGVEWVVVVICFSALVFFGPRLWERLERLEPGPDYRLPYELGNDYWLYNRYCRWACAHYETLVIGDSVIWGHYVLKDNTLSHYLNEAAGSNQFANLGVDGIHPAALAGLVKYYGRDITDKNVVLHLNPLWMSSRKHDLQTDKEFHFDHPKLVPQFTPKIACYKESYSNRLSIVIERYVPFLSWTSHLRKAYFDSMDLATWTIEHPYEDPLGAITLELRGPQDEGQGEHISWVEKGIAKQDLQWVELETSWQWRFFRGTVELLKARGNRVFVVVGPFNEHMLKGKSIEIYERMKSKIERWLLQNDVPYYVPSALPSDLYCDASHPLSEGYAMLARQLFKNQAFGSHILR